MKNLFRNTLFLVLVLSGCNGGGGSPSDSSSTPADNPQNQTATAGETNSNDAGAGQTSDLGPTATGPFGFSCNDIDLAELERQRVDLGIERGSNKHFAFIGMYFAKQDIGKLGEREACLKTYMRQSWP